MTDITVKPRGKGRVDVFLNGKFVGSANLTMDGNFRGRVRLMRLKKVV